MLQKCKWNCQRQVVVIPTAEVGNKVSLALKKHICFWQIRAAGMWGRQLWPGLKLLFMFSNLNWGIWPLFGWHPLMYLVMLITVKVLMLARPKSSVKKPSTWGGGGRRRLQVKQNIKNISGLRPWRPLSNCSRPSSVKFVCFRRYQI